MITMEDVRSAEDAECLFCLAESLVGERDRLLAEAERLRAECERLRYPPCSVCAGSKRLLTGELCGICSGTGLKSEEIVGLRKECWKARNACEEAKRKADDHRRHRDEYKEKAWMYDQLCK